VVLCLTDDLTPSRGLGIELSSVEGFLDGFTESIPQFGHLLSLSRSAHDREQLHKLRGIVTNRLVALSEVIKLSALLAAKVDGEAVIKQPFEEARQIWLLGLHRHLSGVVVVGPTPEIVRQSVDTLILCESTLLNIKCTLIHELVKSLKISHSIVLLRRYGLQKASLMLMTRSFLFRVFVVVLSSLRESR
jgi:hypothetical protein